CQKNYPLFLTETRSGSKPIIRHGRRGVGGRRRARPTPPVKRAAPFSVSPPLQLGGRIRVATAGVELQWRSFAAVPWRCLASSQQTLPRASESHCASSGKSRADGERM